MAEKKGLRESEEELINDNSLTPKEKLFCMNYLKHFNAKKAYEEAGYTSNYAKQAAHIMLKKEHIKDYIIKMRKELFTDQYIDAKAVLQRHIDIAFADITDYVDFGHRTYKDSKGNERFVNELRFKDSKNIDGTLIESIMGGKGAMIKLVSKEKSLETLAKYTGLNENQLDGEFKIIIQKASEVNED